jgi:hypothetical protein
MSEGNGFSEGGDQGHTRDGKMTARRRQDRRVKERRLDDRRASQRLGEDRRERDCRADDVKVGQMTEELRHTAWLEAMIELEIAGVWTPS